MASNISSNPHPTLPPWEWGVRQSGPMNMDIMSKNVLEFKEVCDKHKLQFVLMFGTLLGAMREGRPLTNDSDFDVVCFSRDRFKWYAVKSELEIRGFYIPSIVPHADDYIIRDGEKIDINWMIPFGKFYVYTEEVYYPKEYFDKLHYTSLFNESFSIPSNAEQLLTDLYGNWKIPSSAKGKLNIYKK